MVCLFVFGFSSLHFLAFLLNFLSTISTLDLFKVMILYMVDHCFPETLTVDYVEEKIKFGLGGGLAERVALRLRNEWNAAKIQSRGRFSVYEKNSSTDKEGCSADAKTSGSIVVKEEPKEEPEKEVCALLFFVFFMEVLFENYLIAVYPADS